MKKTKIPKVGDKIYISSSCSISHGSTDIAGGLATVSNVYKSMSGDDPNCLFVEVEESDRSYNWSQILVDRQDELKKQYGKRKAHRDPDIDTPWLEKGDTYSSYDATRGKTESGIYKGII